MNKRSSSKQLFTSFLKQQKAYSSYRYNIWKDYGKDFLEYNELSVAFNI